jgi:hypothetical protein
VILKDLSQQDTQGIEMTQRWVPIAYRQIISEM